MKSWLFGVIGVILLAVGLLWTLQGLAVIKGGFMSGNKVFFALGLLVALGGIATLYSGVRRKSPAKR
jgi:predicted phage tail protein